MAKGFLPRRAKIPRPSGIPAVNASSEKDAAHFQRECAASLCAKNTIPNKEKTQLLASHFILLLS
jgi:hypothetical protein